MDGSAIMGAIRGVLTGALGSVRTVAPGTLAESVHSDSSDLEKWTRASSSPRFDVMSPPPKSTKAVGPQDASKHVLEQRVTVRITFAAQPLADLIDARRYDPRSDAMDIARDCVSALTWSGNLLEDESANPTAIISAALREEREPTVFRDSFGSEQGLYEVDLHLVGNILESRPVVATAPAGALLDSNGQGLIDSSGGYLLENT